jgi:hypothetical protein
MLIPLFIVISITSVTILPAEQLRPRAAISSATLRELHDRPKKH